MLTHVSTEREKEGGNEKSYENRKKEVNERKKQRMGAALVSDRSSPQSWSGRNYSMSWLH